MKFFYGIGAAIFVLISTDSICLYFAVIFGFAALDNIFNGGKKP